jgi:hypothetical protein
LNWNGGVGLALDSVLTAFICNKILISKDQYPAGEGLETRGNRVRKNEIRRGSSSENPRTLCVIRVEMSWIAEFRQCYLLGMNASGVTIYIWHNICI